MSKYKLSNLLPLLFFVLAMVLFIGMSQAHATKPKPPKPVPQEQHQKQHQSQGQHQGQAQGQHQEASGGDAFSDVDVHTGSVTTDANANIGDVSNQQNVDVAGDLAAASTAYAAGAYTNMECGATASASKQDISEGFSLSSIIPWWASRQIRDCWRRDNANWMDSMGLHDEAIVARCATRAMLIQYKTEDACYDTLVSKLRVRQDLESELTKAKDERDTYIVMYEEQSKLAQKLTDEISEKRLVEAVSK